MSVAFQYRKTYLRLSKFVGAKKRDIYVTLSAGQKLLQWMLY